MSSGTDGQLEASKEKFYHPYEPYDIQLQLMQAIYATLLGNYKVGIFESPTGTGKTLSIICSSMRWLREARRHKYELNGQLGEDDDDDEPDWVKESIESRYLRDTKVVLENYETHLKEIKNKTTAPPSTAVQPKRKIQRLEVELDREDSYLPRDYSVGKGGDLAAKNEVLHGEIQDMIASLKKEHGGIDSGIEQLLLDESTVYFTSRTHLQLSQFADQLRLTKFPSSFSNMSINELIKYFPLGSRKQLCINEKVLKLSSTSMITEACMDLQKDTAKKSSSCQYYDNYQTDLKHSDGATEKKFRDLTLSEVHDIEDLAEIGRSLKICPYYASRDTFAVAEVVSVPYQLIIDHEIRKTLGINIRDSVVIIDEAHNLIDSIIAINSVCVSVAELRKIESNLGGYLTKFMSRLNGGNRVNLLKLHRLVKHVIAFIADCERKRRVKNGLEVHVGEIFADSKGGDLINVYQLEKYLKESKVAFKIESYSLKLDEQAGLKVRSGPPLLFKLIKFFKLISNPSKEGKLFFDVDGGVSLNYMLLDPIPLFKEIVEQCKCVILCGGTMEPIEDFTDYLFPYIDKSQIRTFSCEHIIPKENLAVVPVSKAGNVEFDFSFTGRNSALMIERLGEYVILVCQVAPKGAIVFFPSYKYLDQVIEVWKKSVWARLAGLKTIFSEPKDSKMIDQVLSDYSEAVAKSGAILFSVVGGKVSEGINFSNDLARAVIMVGLPYPNIFSGEIINRRKYLEQTVVENGGSVQDARAKSVDFYENLCMKAVNQSVGRAIRNNRDYAMIFLVDRRFKNEKIQSKLSGWIKKELVEEPIDVQGLIRGFFLGK